jgi:hypothetical protein
LCFDQLEKSGDVFFFIAVQHELVLFVEKEHGRKFPGEKTGDELVVFIREDGYILFYDQFGTEIFQKWNNIFFGISGDHDHVDVVHGLFIVVVFADGLHAMGAFRIKEDKKGFFPWQDILLGVGSVIVYSDKVEIRKGFDLRPGTDGNQKEAEG